MPVTPPMPNAQVTDDCTVEYTVDGVGYGLDKAMAFQLIIGWYRLDDTDSFVVTDTDWCPVVLNGLTDAFEYTQRLLNLWANRREV